VTDQADQILRTVGMTLGVVGIGLSLRGGIDAAGAVAAGKLVLVGVAIMIVLFGVFNIVGGTPEER